METSRSHQIRKDGTEATYERHLPRCSLLEDGKVRKETLANLSHCRGCSARPARTGTWLMRWLTSV